MKTLNTFKIRHMDFVFNVRIIFLYCLLIHSYSAFSQSKAELLSGQKRDDFFYFLHEFSTDSEFQISRIKFPLLLITWNETYTELDTLFVQKHEWEFRHFYFGSDNDSFGQVYDSFDHKLRDTNERVFAWHGIGNGIREYFYFMFTEGKWYLIKIEDLSS